MVHQANKPSEISWVLNLFCSRQGLLCMKEASGCWSKFTCPGWYPTLRCTLQPSRRVQWVAVWIMGRSVIACSSVCSASSHSAVQRRWWGQHVPHSFHSTRKNITRLRKPGFWEQSEYEDF